MPTSDTWTTDNILPDTKVHRYGLELDRASFDRLGEALDRISDAERSAEVAASALRVF
ncbi:hypothetical protein [Mycobacterium sp. IS-1590]|uniref:hypothetical protein n=1 Tax=Mycobacterium sp. IS-1590 TaxID=1772286 RepID=UPI0012E3EFAA|nr:hypothetical protein [Mycobacterium sp. IS-1590]